MTVDSSGGGSGTRPSDFDPAAVAPLLLAWYGAEGRDLPWRRTRDPYCIWLSEIMLQQTGVETVIPYFERFLATFPTVAELAAAPVERVVEAWAGLGYYSRARNLHAAARVVLEEFGGRIPDTPEGLAALPGVGRSTTGAILAIAFGRRGVILDGNVRRVLVRLFALDGDPRGSRAEKQLWAWAEALTPEERPGDYAQAIMDLGATLCTPKKPDCHRCPLAAVCAARAQGRQEVLPESRAKKTIPVVVEVALLLVRDGRLLVRRRPLSGMLGGLWEFPAAAVRAGEKTEAAARRLLAELGLCAEPTAAGTVAHAYSHFKLDLRLFCAAAAGTERVGEGETAWLDPAEPARYPLHGAHRKALKFIEP